MKLLRTDLDELLIIDFRSFISLFQKLIQYQLIQQSFLLIYYW